MNNILYWRGTSFAKGNLSIVRLWGGSWGPKGRPGEIGVAWRHLETLKWKLFTNGQYLVFKCLSYPCCHIFVYWWLSALYMVLHLSFRVISVITDVHSRHRGGDYWKGFMGSVMLELGFVRWRGILVRNLLGKMENLGKSTNVWISTELDSTAEGWRLRDFVLRWWWAQQRYYWKIREAKRKNSTFILPSHKGREKTLRVERAGNFYFYIYFK